LFDLHDLTLIIYFTTFQCVEYEVIFTVHFFSKFPKNWWLTKIKETPLFRSVEYNIYSGNDSFEDVKKRFLSESESMMFERYCHDCENMQRKRGVSLIFVNHQFFGNLLKKWIDKIRMYNKDGTRLQNKGVNLIVYLIFWSLKWFMYDTLSIHFFSKFPKNWWFTKIKETPLFRSVEYNIYSGNDSFQKVNRWCLLWTRPTHLVGFL
jgi:hypothetical protein